LESQSLSQKAEQAVVAIMESHDAHRTRTRRFGLLFTGSALLHVVAGIALLRSWGGGPLQQAPVAEVRTDPVASDDVQVVRLELAVSRQSAQEVLRVATTETSGEAEQGLKLTAPEKTIVK
jgi:hypothetical protein